MEYLLIQLVLISFVLAVYNGYLILWGVHKNIPDFETRRKKWSKIWHGLGWVVRFQIAILIAHFIYYVQDFVVVGIDWLLILKWELLYISVAAVLYDFIINLIRYIAVGAPPLFYVDNKGINAILLTIFRNATGVWLAKLLFLVGSIVLLFIV